MSPSGASSRSTITGAWSLGPLPLRAWRSTQAASTRFGRDHRFDEVRSVADFQARVPLRTYEDLWNDELSVPLEAYPALAAPALQAAASGA